MQEEYDFSKGRKNPYVKTLKQPVTIDIDNDTLQFFQRQSENSLIHYQKFINLYLSDCAMQNKQLHIEWK